MDEYHSLHRPKEPIQGRPRTITEEMQEVYTELSLFSLANADSESLLDLLAARPSLYIDEQIYHLGDTFGVHIDAHVVSSPVAPEIDENNNKLHFISSGSLECTPN